MSLEARLARAEALIRQLQGALGGMRVIRGTVNFDGTIIEGTGFSATQNATGDYTVTFDTAFSDPPSVVVSKVDPSTGGAELDGNPTASSFDVATTASGGGAANRDFCFIAIGPA